jgi:hypothetical protein
MTLVIGTTNPEGVILTADSRQTYTNRSNMPRIASDNATKILQLNDIAAVATSGNAFFTDGGKFKPIQSFMEEFRDTKLTGLTTTMDIANALQSFTEGWIRRIAEAAIRAQVTTQDGTNCVIGTATNGQLSYSYTDSANEPQTKDWFVTWVWFIVVGRDPDGTCHAITTAPFQPPSLHGTSDAPQLQWIGQTEVLNKLLTGTDPFVISTSTMTIQDAIDFSILLTRTTENIQKFSDGVAGSQGGVPGVGGPIDVVFVPTKSGDLQFLSKKTLKVNDTG